MGKIYELRTYQAEGINRIIEIYKDGETMAYLDMVQGSGKSLTSLGIISKMLEIPAFAIKNIIVCVPQNHIGEGFNKEGNILKISNKNSEILLKCPGVYKPTKNLGTKEMLRNYLKYPSNSIYITSHATLAQYDISLLPKDCSGILLVGDEIQHVSNIDDIKDCPDFTIITSFFAELEKRGGRILYVSGTPYRGRLGEIGVIPEGVRGFIWNYSDNIRAGYSPKDLEFEVLTLEGCAARSSKELLGECEPENVKPILDRWEQAGRPKLVLKFSENSLNFKEKIFAEGKKRGIRIFDSIGQDKQCELIKVLKHEQEIENYKDSRYDIILACGRFNEGTDWPLCSACFNIGIMLKPEQFMLRAGRCKYKFINGEKFPRFAGMPEDHLDKILYICFIPEGQRNLYENFYSDWHEFFILFACKLKNMQTAKPYLNIRNIFTRKKEENVEKSIKDKFNDLENILIPNENTKARADCELLKIKAHCENKAKSVLEVVLEKREEIIEKEGEGVYISLLANFANDPAFKEVVEKSIDKVIKKLKNENNIEKRTKKRRLLNGLLRKELEEALQEVCDENSDIMLSDYRDTLKIIGKISNYEKYDKIEKDLKNFIPKSLWFLNEKIKSYKDKRGNYPPIKGKWAGWDQWIKKETGISLRDYINTFFDVHRERSLERQKISYKEEYIHSIIRNKLEKVWRCNGGVITEEEKENILKCYSFNLTDRVRKSFDDFIQNLNVNDKITACGNSSSHKIKGDYNGRFF